MPMITVQFAVARRAAPARAEIAAVASRLAADILRKDPGVTAVLVEEADPAGWFCGGAALAELGLSAVWLDIRITDGTNTKDEKAAFVAAAFAEFRRLLGPLHEESYIHVHDVRADAYGYGGLTQERRYIAGRPAEAAAA